jgi:phosphate transport system substrate-binding protein
MSKENPFYKNTSFFIALGVMTTALISLCSFAINNKSHVQNFLGSLSNTKQTSPSPSNVSGSNYLITARYGGSTSSAPIGEGKEMDRWMREKGLTLEYQKPTNGRYHGSKTGVELLKNGSLDISLSSEDLRYLDQDKRLQQLQIASDSIVFYVNKDLKAVNNLSERSESFPGLTISKLKGILTGNITNWKDVGGPDRAIHIYIRDVGASGTVNFIQRNLLSPASFKKYETPVVTTKSIQAVQKDIGGIGFAPAAEVCDQRNNIQVLSLSVTNDKIYVNPCEPNKNNNTNDVNLNVLENGTYPKQLKRPLFVVYRSDVELSKNAGKAYADLLRSDKGKEIVRKAGMIPY